MSEQQNIGDGVAEAMREPVRVYADLVREIGGETVQSLTLFGAVVTPDFDPRRHTARSVLAVGEIDLTMLWRLSEHGAKLGKNSITAPLIMTPASIRASLDTFPLELLEIQQKHVVWFGSDYFEDLEFEKRHLRLQCERELKTLLIGLRQGLLAAARREKLLGALERDVAEGLLRTLRGMLWLKGERQARPAADLLAAVERSFERKLEGIRVALGPGTPHGWDEFQRFYRDVAGLGELVDAW